MEIKRSCLDCKFYKNDCTYDPELLLPEWAAFYYSSAISLFRQKRERRIQENSIKKNCPAWVKEAK